MRLAIDSFRSSKARFALTALGMVIGSASVILVVTIGLTGRDYALGLIEKIGTNMVELEYSGGGATGTESAVYNDYLTREDERAWIDLRCRACSTPRRCWRCMTASASAAAWSRTRWCWASCRTTSRCAT
jgi:hypothetical protein